MKKWKTNQDWTGRSSKKYARADDSFELETSPGLVIVWPIYLFVVHGPDWLNFYKRSQYHSSEFVIQLKIIKILQILLCKNFTASNSKQRNILGWIKDNWNRVGKLVSVKFGECFVPQLKIALKRTSNSNVNTVFKNKRKNTLKIWKNCICNLNLWRFIYLKLIIRDIQTKQIKKMLQL